MKLGYRIGRVAVLAILAVLIGRLQGNINGISVFFGAGMLVSAFLTLIYVFINFDKNLDEKVVMEMIVDGFVGLVIFTYPHSDNTFFVIVFSFWIAIMGLFMLAAGLFNERNKDYFWFYVLAGIVNITFGFVIMHVTDDNAGILGYLIAFVLLIYSYSHCRILCKKKHEVY